MAAITIFEVGGSIRDELLGRESSDRDFTVLAPSYEDMRNYLVSRNATIFQERPQFVAIRAKLDGIGCVDFTLARTESFYTDGRHPDSVTPAQTIEQDLARRDFRMNAMARQWGTNTIIDPFGGQTDIINGSIACVGDARKRMDEDKLRAFRCLRFMCQLQFDCSVQTDMAISQLTANEFGGVTPERLHVELSKMFKADSFLAMRLLRQFPALCTVVQDKGIWFKPSLEARG